MLIITLSSAGATLTADGNVKKKEIAGYQAEKQSNNLKWLKDRTGHNVTL
ncbi:hypothetical protein CKS_0062 [Pantoea stewartii subsp. stewartii DC283]|uniref:Uncharacterized protein n=1 Tax=Pantoea stewartii subsp. stewartii DC283 TaxID=660596 RepID=H3R8X1_PANSE|nr:hypothetical protein CKS_0062 [Pantoea stewartii subsp. stewartii DC283]